MAAAIAGCGGDDEPTAETTRQLPDLSVPTTEDAPEVTPPAEQPTTTTVDPATETLPLEGPEPAPEEEPPADTPENDAPPPEGSPAERFEEWCNENPGACG